MSSIKSTRSYNYSQCDETPPLGSPRSLLVTVEAKNIAALSLDEAQALIFARLNHYAADNGRLRALDLFRKFKVSNSGGMTVADFRNALYAIRVEGAKTETIKNIMKQLEPNCKAGELDYKYFSLALVMSTTLKRERRRA